MIDNITIVKLKIVAEMRASVDVLRTNNLLLLAIEGEDEQDVDESTYEAHTKHMGEFARSTGLLDRTLSNYSDYIRGCRWDEEGTQI